MLLTIIPFIADGVANDWPKAVACLERTISSILANPEKELRALVICQNRPPLNIKDERYLFLDSKQPKPNRYDANDKRRDKGMKIFEAFEVARAIAPEYVMIVDADDLISNTLVSYVHQRPDFDAFCMKTGYEWREGTSHFTLRPFFNQYCGSSFVWRFNEKLFPVWLGKSSHKRIADQSHSQIEEAMDAEGLRVDKIYEPKAVYVTGLENHLGYRLTIKRRIKDVMLSPWRNYKLTTTLKNEFGLK